MDRPQGDRLPQPWFHRWHTSRALPRRRTTSRDSATSGYNFLVNNGIWDTEKRIKLAFCCLLTAVGILQILAGDEFADQHDRLDANGNVTESGGKEVDPVNYCRLDEDWRHRIFEYVAVLVKLRTFERCAVRSMTPSSSMSTSTTASGCWSGSAGAGSRSGRGPGEFFRFHHGQPPGPELGLCGSQLACDPRGPELEGSHAEPDCPPQLRRSRADLLLGGEGLYAGVINSGDRAARKPWQCRRVDACYNRWSSAAAMLGRALRLIFQIQWSSLGGASRAV